ncbi:MAG: hypothetical protein R2703_01875 [Micropruina glycogenica]
MSSAFHARDQEARVDIDRWCRAAGWKPAGLNSATLVLTPTPDGARALAVPPALTGWVGQGWFWSTQHRD